MGGVTNATNSQIAQNTKLDQASTTSSEPEAPQSSAELPKTQDDPVAAARTQQGLIQNVAEYKNQSDIRGHFMREELSTRLQNAQSGPVLFNDSDSVSAAPAGDNRTIRDKVKGAGDKPPFELNKNYQKLPDSVKVHIQNAISSGKLDTAAKEKLIELVTSRGFDKLSPSIQHDFINLQEKNPQLSDNLIKLSHHSIGFHSLGSDGQSEFLKLLETNAKDPAKINNLMEVGMAKGLNDLTPANRKTLYDALNGPHADDIAKNFAQMAAMYKGPLKSMDATTQKEVLNRMIDYTNKGDATKVKDLIDVTTWGRFSELDSYDQKLILKILEETKGLGKNLNLLLLSSGFEQMTGVMRSRVLNMMADLKGDSTRIASIADTIGTTPGFAMVSNNVKNTILDTLQKDPMDTHRILRYLSQPWFLAADENRQIELLTQ